jgi:hypothetical protein
MTVELPYELEQPRAYRWTESAFALLTSRRLDVRIATIHGIGAVTASGECPRCRHDVEFTQELDAPASAGAGGRVKSPRILETLGHAAREGAEDQVGFSSVDVECRCRGTHPGRPNSLDRGCGIMFRASLRTDRG